MAYKAKEIEVPKEDPFKNDRLNRKDEVLNISTLLQNISSPIVFSINAPWGTGKSTFLRMLHMNLLNQGNNAIYFSAWETDFASDPLLAFLGEINKSITSQNKKLNVEAWKNAKKAGSQIIKRGLPIAIKLATMGVLDLDKITEEEVSKLMETYSNDLIKEYEERKTAIDDFKKNISKLTGNGKDDTLYIIIDELDRCRPTYAIELLERIKHLLNVKGIVFVLALDRNQLSHSVKGVYGNDFEARGYLKRFIDIEYSLNEIQESEYVDYLFDYFELNEFFKQDNRTKISSLQNEESHLKRVLKTLISYKKMPLRDIEQLIAKLKLVLLSTKYNEFTYPALLAFLLIVKEYHTDLYNEFVDEGSSAEPILDLLKKIIPEDQLYESFECALIEGFIISSKYTQGQPSGQQILNKYVKRLDGDGISKTESQYLDKVKRIAESPTGGIGRSVSLNHLVQRIEMSKQFNFAINSEEDE